MTITRPFQFIVNIINGQSLTRQMEHEVERQLSKQTRLLRQIDTYPVVSNPNNPSGDQSENHPGR